MIGDELVGDTVAGGQALVLEAQFAPALPQIVAALGGARSVAGKTTVVWPGAVLLAASGAVYAVGGAPYYGGAKMPAGRKAVRLAAYGAKGYTVTDSSGALSHYGS